MIRKIFLVLILSLTLGCLPDYREVCITNEIEIKSNYDKELQKGTEEWFTNNTQYRYQYQRDFINLIAIPSYKEELKTNMPMEVMIAQAILESGWGRSDLAVDYNNYFGIKEYRKEADAAKMSTYEYVNGKRKKVKANFRKYCSPEDCLADRTDWFMNNYRYNDLNFATTDWVDFTLELKNRGYATDPDYDIKLIRIVKKYKIDKYSNWLKGREREL